MEEKIKQSPVKYTAHIDVRYAETDAMAVVHHSVYAVWFEQARSEMLRASGVPFAAFEAEGYHTPLLSLEVQFHKPCRYGETVDVSTTLDRIDRLRFLFTYKITVNGELRTTGSTLHVFTLHGRPSRKAPESFLKAFGLSNETDGKNPDP